jgi:putative nucleotidyltransferase with HDIG domain
MFGRILKRLRSRSVTLSAKIMALITLAVAAGLSTSGYLIYDNLRSKAFHDTSDALLQVAGTAAATYDTSGLEELKGPEDRAKPAYRMGMMQLGRIWKENHFEKLEKWERLSVIRYEKGRGLSLALALGGAENTGRRIPAFPGLMEAVEHGETIVQEEGDEGNAWLRAFAPIQPQDPNAPDRYIICVETNESRLQAMLLRSVGEIALASLAGLALALVGAWLLTQQITKPLRAFVDVMRLMQSTGDFDIRIDVHPEDRDMSVLEDAFISLLAKVRESRRKEESSYWSTLQALVSALDIRDNETAGHSVRVTRYSLAIAERLRVNDSLMEQVRQGALLHDIGKIGVPDAILRKTGKLAEPEWKEMQKHPVIGKGFLEDIEFLRPATAVVYCHHERWDGAGYPSGLTGDAIPMAARIFAVADALDTITSDRYYKKAQSFSQARMEIESSSGTQFDPSVVKAFLTLPEKAFLRIRLDTNMAVLQIEKFNRGKSRV